MNKIQSIIVYFMTVNFLIIHLCETLRIIKNVQRIQIQFTNHAGNDIAQENQISLNQFAKHQTKIECKAKQIEKVPPLIC